MKVAGTGGPAFLTLRLREREIPGLMEALEHRAAAAAQAREETRPSDTADFADGRTPADVLAAALALQDEVTVARPNEQGRVVIAGPTWLLGPAIRSATVEATEQLVDAVRRFSTGDDCPANTLREAVSAASAWSETLLAYDHAENFGLRG